MNQKYKVFLPTLILGIVIFLSSCGPVTPFPTGTPTSTPTATRTPTRTPRPTSTKIPTATPYAKLDELATLGEGTLPQIVYSNDGQKIYVTDGFTLRVLNANDYSEITSFEISDDGYASIYTTNPDGSLIVVNRFSVFDITTHKEIARASGSNDPAVGPVFTPDNKYIVYRAADRTSGGRYDSICLLDLSVRKEFDPFEEPDCYPTLDNDRFDIMTNPAMSPDGQLVAAGYSESTKNILFIWDLHSKAILHEIKEQPSQINSVAFSPDGSTLATASDDGLVRLWNPATGQIKRSITAFVDDVVNVEFSPDGRRLLVDVIDQPTISYVLSTGKQEAVPPAPLDPLSKRMLKEGYMLSGSGSKTRFSPDGKTLAVGHGSIQVWDVQSQTLKVALFADHRLGIAGMTYSPDGNHLAVVTVDGDVYAWDIRSGQQEFFVSASTLLGIQFFSASGFSGLGPGIGAGVYGEQSVAFSPDASQIALTNGSVVEIWDIQTASRALILEQTQPVTFPTKVSFSMDGQFVYAALNRNRGLAVWNAKTGKLVRQLNLPHVDPNAFTATDLQGPLFARNNYDDRNEWIEIWNIETGKMTKLPTHWREVEPLRFSADGKFFAGLSSHNQLYIWRTDTGQLVFVSDKDFNIGDLAIGPDGKLLATADFGKATLWDVAKYTGASFQTGFAPMPMPFTPTPWSSESYSDTTNTPQPTQVVKPLPLPQVQAEAINPQNATGLQLSGQIGKGQVSQMSWSKENRTVLIASSQGLYQLDPLRLKETAHFEPKSLWVTHGQILPDGRSLLAGFTVDGKIQVWDAANDKMLVELKGGGPPAISPDGQWLVYEDADKGLGTWNLTTGQPGTVLLSSYYLSWPIFSPDSKLVAAIQSDRSIRIWDLKTGVLVNAAGGPEAEITDMSFSPDGHYLLGAAGGSAWRWSMSPILPPLEVNLFKGEVDGNLTVFKETVTAIASNADNSLLAIGTSDKTIWLYRTKTGQISGNLTGHSTALAEMAFSPDGNQLVSVDKDGRMVLWDIAGQTQIFSTHGFGGSIKGITTRLDGTISAWGQNTVWTFSPQNAELKQITYIPATRILAASPAGDLVAGYIPLQISLYDANTGELEQTFPQEAVDIWVEYYWEGDIIRQFYGALFSPDGKRLATFGTGGMWMYSLPDGKLVSSMGDEAGFTTKAAFSPDGEWLVASIYEMGSSPSLIGFNNAERIFSGFGINQRGEGRDYSQYAFSPDKRWIGLLRDSWDSPATLEIVDTATGLVTRQLTFENTDLISLAFNPSATLIAIGQSDGNIVIVDFATLKVIATMEGHLGPVTAISFSQDGQRIISAGQDGTIKVWGLP